MKIPNWIVTTVYLGIVFAVAGISLYVKYERNYSSSSEHLIIDSFPPWIAGSAPSFLYSFGIVLTLLAFPRVKRYLALCIGGGALAYEFIQIWMPSRTFTWLDVAATIVGIAAAFLVELIVSWSVPNFRTVNNHEAELRRADAT